MENCTVKITINPRYSDYASFPYEVDAEVVQGKDGIFATWRHADLVSIAAGDNGNWWKIASYHVRWVPDIINVLKQVSE